MTIARDGKSRLLGASENQIGQVKNLARPGYIYQRLALRSRLSGKIAPSQPRGLKLG